MKELSKTELKKLLKAYGAVLGDLIQSQDDPCEYQCNICYLRIELDPEDSDYVTVTHSDSSGKRLCVDTWRRDKKSPVLVKRLKDMVAEESEIKSKNRHAEKLKEENKKIKNELIKKNEDIRLLRDELDMKDEELFQLKETLEKLQNHIKEKQSEQESHKLSKSPGRPKETERITKKTQEISVLIQEGMTDKQIMERLILSKATYYRYKRKINS